MQFHTSWSFPLIYHSSGQLSWPTVERRCVRYSCISLSFSDAFLSASLLYFSEFLICISMRFSTAFLSVSLLYFSQFFKCTSPSFSTVFPWLLRVDGGRLCGGYPDCSVDSSHLVSITDIIGTPPARCLHREPVVSVCVIVFLYVYVFVCICSVDSHLLSIRDIIGTPPARCLHCF